MSTASGSSPLRVTMSSESPSCSGAAASTSRVTSGSAAAVTRPAMAAFASRGPIAAAASRTVAPSSSSRGEPSGRVTCRVMRAGPFSACAPAHLAGAVDPASLADERVETRRGYAQRGRAGARRRCAPAARGRRRRRGRSRRRRPRTPRRSARQSGEEDDVRRAGAAPGPHLPAELRPAAAGEVPVDDGEVRRVGRRAAATWRAAPSPDSTGSSPRPAQVLRHLAKDVSRVGVAVRDQQLHTFPLAGSAAPDGATYSLRAILGRSASAGDRTIA